MGQGTTRKKDEEATGRDLPNADGMVSDEDVNAIGGNKRGPTGQDHSLDNYEETSPSEGVGVIQDSSDTTSDIAHNVD